MTRGYSVGETETWSLSDSKYYHCGDPRTGPADDYYCLYSLCGINLQDTPEAPAWDRVEHFVTDWWGPESTMPPRCPECMAHPDYPFLLLGEL